MRAITEGAITSETGIKMALALVATLYGLIVANFIVAPIGEGIGKRVAVDHFKVRFAYKLFCFWQKMCPYLRVRKCSTPLLPEIRELTSLVR